MLTKALALMMTATFAALALEVVFGVHLGISGWVHHVLGGSEFSLIPSG
jgi:hypothetical protein